MQLATPKSVPTWPRSVDAVAIFRDGHAEHIRTGTALALLVKGLAAPFGQLVIVVDDE
jgi:hypothetical protein